MGSEVSCQIKLKTRRREDQARTIALHMESPKHCLRSRRRRRGKGGGGTDSPPDHPPRLQPRQGERLCVNFTPVTLGHVVSKLFSFVTSTEPQRK